MEMADPTEWQSFGLEGKRVFELTVSDNHLYAAAGKDGLFRKDLSDARSQWEYLGLAESEVNFGVQSFYRNPETGTMYAAFYEPNFVGHGVFRSVNDGQTWEPFDEGIVLNPGDDRNAVVLKLGASSAEPDRIFAGTIGGIFIKRPGENSWENPESDPPLNTYSLAFNPQNSSEVWIGGNDDRSTARFAVTEDGGNSWVEKTSSMDEVANLMTNEIKAITFQQNDSSVIYMCLNYEILKSLNSGEGWIILESDLNKEAEFKDPNDDIFTFFTDLSINSLNPDELVASGKFLYRSRDAGDTWKVVSDTTRSPIIDIQVDWDNRVVYGAILNPEKGVFKIKI